MNILVIEPHMEGHHGVWLRWLVQGLVNKGFEVTIATIQASKQHPVVPLIEALATSRVKMLFVPWDKGRSHGYGALHLVTMEIRYWRLFKDMFSKVRRGATVDAVFIPYLDYCANAIGLLGSPFGTVPWSAVVMRPAFHYQSMGVPAKSSSLDNVKEFLLSKLLMNKTLLTIFTLDELLVQYFERKDGQLAKRLAFLPDPVDISGEISKDEAKEVISNTT